MTDRRVSRLAVRPSPSRNALATRPSVPALAGRLSSRELRAVDKNLQIQVAEEEGTAFKAAWAQRYTQALYEHGSFCVNNVFNTNFRIAYAQQIEEARAYGLDAAHAFSQMAYEDIADLTRIAATGLKDIVAKPLAPEKRR